jgi:hypothetical protein
VRLFARTSGTGSSKGSDSRRRLSRRTPSVRRGSLGFAGSSAPTHRRPRFLLAFAASLLAFLVLGVALASAVAPVVTVEDASAVEYTTAHVEGTVDGQGKGTFCQFEYISQAQVEENVLNGLAEFEFAAQAGCPEEIPAGGSGPQNVENNLSFLTPGTVYHLRLLAFNGDGGGEAVAANTFETKPIAPPGVTINPVTTFTGTTAKFSGTIEPGTPAGDPGAFEVHWEFVCEPSCPGVEGSIPADSATNSVEVKPEATGLEPNTEYHVKLVASNAGGSAEAGPELFESDPVAPTVQTLGATAGTDTASLGANVNPHNSTVTYQFEWGQGAGLDQRAPATPAPLGAADNFAHLVTAPIVGLTKGAEYSFRVVATNTETAEVSVGAVQTFRTLGPPAAPGSCGNEAIRSAQGVTALPDCRAYEMVTPVDKNGGNLSSLFATTADGDRVTAGSPNSAGADAKSNSFFSNYLLTRESGGWEAANLTPPAGASLAFDGGLVKSGVFSEDLGTGIELTKNSSLEPRHLNIFTTTPAGTTTWITRPTKPGAPLFDKVFTGVSADASHIVFESHQEFAGWDTEGVNEVWESFGGSIRLVSIMPGAEEHPFVEATFTGAGLNGGISNSSSVISSLPQPTVISRDGSKIFFTGPASSGTGQSIYVREDGARTRELTVTQRPLPEGAIDGVPVFRGAALDGTKMLFTSGSMLTADATPGGGLYRYDLRTGKLQFLTPTTNSGGAEIEGTGLPVISADAERVYFVARAQLVPGEGEAGAHNLYYSGPGGIRFIADLADADQQNWAGLGEPLKGYTARATPDGRHLVFQSIKALTGYRSEGHIEIYKWDEGDGVLRCVSCGKPGTEAKGDASLLAHPSDPGNVVNTVDEAAQTAESRSLTTDGSRVFYQTTDSLVPRDVNGVSDVYKYEAGRNYLISSGTNPRPSEILDNSADGRDIFFSTAESLVPRDIDGGAGDIYDAREEGGFPEGAPEGSCTGGDCQATSTPPPFSPPASSSIPAPAKTQKPSKLKTALKSCRKKPTTKKQRTQCEAKAKKRYAKPHGSSKKKGA